MSVLAALTRAYERLPDNERPPFGFSMEKIGALVSLHADGTVAHIVDLRDEVKTKRVPRMMLAPQPVKRTAGVAPNLLWDKTSYALGVTAGEGKRTAEEHAAFVARHEAALQDTQDEGLRALLAFLRGWTPDQFAALGAPDDLKDLNIVFALESERLRGLFLHDRPAARALLARQSGGDRPARICLVTGEAAPVARLHPSIKGVWGAQSSGAALVSFNREAFASYGHEQGDNAPVSDYAAFAYTSALNRFLDRDSGHRLQMGDASVVFWADSTDAVAAAMAEAMFREMIDPAELSAQETAQLAQERAKDEITEDRAAVAKVGEKLRRLARGEALAAIEPKLAQGVRFYVLALAPNAARLSVRFYLEQEFGALAENYRAYLRDVALEPWPAHRRAPSIRRLALSSAPAMADRGGGMRFDADQMSPLLTGELLRAALSGAAFPASLLSLLLMRLRSDQFVDAARLALVKAIVVRRMRAAGDLPRRADGTVKEDYLMRSDPDDPNPARRLGRLFAIIERAQRAALGDEINATVVDKYLGAACATPGRVLPTLVVAARNHHIARLGKGHADAKWIKDSDHARRVARGLDRDLGRLMAQFDDGMPMQLSAEEQGLFLVGYYQERWGKTADASEAADIDVTDTPAEETAP